MNRRAISSNSLSKPESPFIGQRAIEVKAFNEADSRLVDVVRGDASLRREMQDVMLAEGDIVVLRSPMKEILGVQAGAGHSNA